MGKEPRLFANDGYKIFNSGNTKELTNKVEKYLHHRVLKLIRQDKTIKLLQHVPGNGGFMRTPDFKVRALLFCN